MAEAEAATTEKMELDESAEVKKVEETNGSGGETEEKKTPVDNTKKYATVAQVAAANPHFRVKISGLPRFYTPQDPLLIDFKRLLHKELGLEFKYIRSPKKGNSWLYITFYDQTNQEKALKLLKQYKWKGRTLICTLVVADVLKRKQEDSGDGSSKRPRLDIPIEEQMLMSTIPYHTVSYDEQLSKKNEEAQCLFKWLAICMEKKTPKLIGYIDQEVAKNSKTKLPFSLDEVRPSPVIDGYRNKCEFRIGQDPTTKKIVVGYRVDNQEDDIIAVAPPDSLRHLPKQMIDVVKVFEEFVQVSPHKPQVMNHDTGVWRLLHVRINRAQQLMVVVLINPTMLDNAAMATLKMELIEYFSTGPASKHGVISLYLHTDNDIKAMGLDKNKRPQGHLELLWGQSHMVEQLLDLHLDIDPNFYFQNNTWGAEVLYKAVTELAAADDNTTVLDLCCGSGGMGLMFAKHCKEVIGVEVQDVNVEDAKKLAAKNGLTNCEFLQGSVDDLFPELEEKLKGKNVIPILDPPRSGISSKLILSLRKMKEAQRIIYVCSNHKLPSKNIMDLALVEGENNEYVGTDPFFPTKVIPVDISPHSLRCELVILLERLDMSKVPKAKRTAPSKLARCLYYSTNRRGGKAGRGGGGGFGGGNPRGRRNFGREPSYGRGYNNFDMPVSYPMRRPMDRYSSFRRDVEEAIDVSYPGRGGPMSRRLAMANAMLEQGLRLASEAMAEDEYVPPGPRPRLPPPPASAMMRRGPPPMMDDYPPSRPPMMRRGPPPPMMEDYNSPDPLFTRRAPPAAASGWGYGRGMQSDSYIRRPSRGGSRGAARGAARGRGGGYWG